MFPAKDGLIHAKGSHLCLVDVAHINREIEPVPGGFHPAVSEEEPLNFMGLSILQTFATADFIPFREPGVKNAMSDNLGYGLVIWMDTSTSGREHHTWPMCPQQLGNL